MWSFLRKIIGRLSGVSSTSDHSALFPTDIDKLRTEFSSSEELEGPGGPITAREAFELAEEIINSFDAQARLRSIESRGQLDAKGQAAGWCFEFLLPSRWGHAKFLFQSGGSDEKLTLKLIPFAAEGSALDRMLQEGQDGFVEQQWKVELERQPALSHSFQDTSLVLQTWATEGKEFDFASGVVLRAFTPPLGGARWELLESPGSKKSLYKLPIE